MDIYHPCITASPRETARLGQEIEDRLVHRGNARIICLYGELGSGKTTFVQGFAKAFGVSSRLLSPTFIIVRRYQTPKTSWLLYHIDLYRVTSKKDLLGLGLPEVLADPDSVVLIEWAEKLGDLLPKHRIDVHFKVLEDGKHKIWKMNQS